MVTERAVVHPGMQSGVMKTQPQQNASSALTIGLLIEGEYIARVIGKQGAGLKQIRESTNCTLQVTESAPGASVRRVTVTGLSRNLGLAVHQALTKAYSSYPDPQATVTVLVPADNVGLIVGKAGANLKKVRDVFKVKTELPRDIVNDPNFGPERRVTMMGAWTNMGQALAMLLGDSAGPQATSMMGGQSPQSGGLTFGDVRKIGADREEIQLHMVVPPQLVGALLGKEGCEIKLLGSTTGCKTLGVTKREFGERRVIIIGTFIQCITAQKALQDVLWAAADKAGIDVTTSTIVFYIRSAAVGSVIGKKGDKLKEIRELTGAKLRVERDETHSQRACIINGPHEQVMQAVSMVNELVSNANFEVGAPPAVTGKRSAPSGGKGDAKRQKVGPEGGITKLLVPAQFAGLIIGKQGSGLAQIRQSCGVHLEVLPTQQTPQWAGSRLVKVQGPLQSRALATMTVLQAAFHADVSSVQLKMLVPETKAGAIVGKQGSNLKQIRESSGINVQLEKAAVMGDRLVTATGALESIKAVASWIMQAVDQSPDATNVAPSNGYSGYSAPTTVAPVGYNYAAAAAYGGYNYAAAYGLAY